MSNFENNAQVLRDAVTAFREFEDKLRRLNKGPLNWTIEEYIKTTQSLYNRFCPFYVGERVKLRKTPQIESDSGWYHCRHFLIKGAEGIVHSREYRPDFANGEGRFVFNIMFDNETWISSLDNKEHPVKDKHTFGFSEDMLEKV